MPVKNHWEQGRETTTNRQMESTPRFETAPHLWKATALTTSPSLLPNNDQSLVEPQADHPLLVGAVVD